MTLFSDRDERFGENLRILNAKFARKPRKLPVRGERPAFTLGGSAPTLVIAASNSPASTMAKADYICSGVDDNLLFQLAIQRMLDGEYGRLLVCEGDYYFSRTVTLTGAIRIEGMGAESTRLHLTAAANTIMFFVDHTAPVPIGPIEIASLDMDGVKASQTAGTSHGIYVAPDGGSTLSLTNVLIHDFRSNGANFDRCSRDVFIDNCGFASNTGDGIAAAVEGTFQITNSVLQLNTGRGIKADGADVKMLGCVIRNNTGHSFSAGGIFESTPKLLIGNEITVNGGYGIEWDGVNGSIIGNYVATNTQDGIIVYGNQPLIVKGNTILANTARGITLAGGAGSLGGVVEGNVVRMNGQHGIYVDADDWTVQGNHVINNSRTTTNTYDGIHVAASVNPSVLNNMVRQTTGAPVQRYAINITAGATGCWRAGNDCRGGGWGTAAYVDAGTASILVWAGGAGDNQ